MNSAFNGFFFVCASFRSYMNAVSVARFKFLRALERYPFDSVVKNLSLTLFDFALAHI